MSLGSGRSGVVQIGPMRAFPRLGSSFGLVWYLLCGADEVRVVLYLLSLARPCSCCSRIKVDLSGACVCRSWNRLAHWLLTFDVSLGYHLLLLLVLGWVSSISMLLTILLLLLLKKNLLLLQQLHLVGILHARWSLSNLSRLLGIIKFLHSLFFFMAWIL